MSITYRLLISTFICVVLPLSLVAQDAPDYLPAEVGNWWLLAAIDGPTFPPDTFYTYREISASIVLQDTTYLQFSNPWIDSDTFRVDVDGRVWSRGYGREDLLFDFTASDDSVYQFPTQRKSGGGGMYNVTVSRDLTVSTHAGIYENCISFAFDEPVVVDEEITYTFAPDVGLIDIQSFETYGMLFEAQVGDSTIFSIVSVEDEEKPEANGLPFSVYPNPIKDQGWIEFQLEKPDGVVIEVFDVSGRKVWALPLVSLPAGQHRLPLTQMRLAPAAYLLRLSTQEGISQSRLIVQY